MNINNAYNVVTSRMTNTGARTWWLAIWPDGALTLRASVGGTPGVIDISSGEDNADGNWHHFTATVDGAVEAKLYVDGVLKATDSTLGGVVNTPSTTVSIGQENTTGIREFNGSIDDIRVYNRVLTAAEIGVLFQQVQ